MSQSQQRKQRAKRSAAKLLDDRKKTIDWYRKTNHMLIPKDVIKRKLRYALHEIAQDPAGHGLGKDQVRVVQAGDPADVYSERFRQPGKEACHMIQFALEGMLQEVFYKALQIAHHCKRIMVKGGDVSLVFELEKTKYGPARAERDRPPEWMTYGVPENV